MIELVFVVAALPAWQPYSVEEAPRQRGNVEARLRVVVPEEGAGPSRARLRLALNFVGPEGLEVQGPRLEDALAGWRIVSRSSSWSQEGERVHWCLTLRVDQVKPGQVPAPGLVAGVRTGPDQPWQEVAWTDLLNVERDVAPPDEMPRLPASPWPARLRWLGLIMACVLGLVFLVRAVRRRLSVRRQLPPAARALALLEVPALPPAERFAHAEAVVRDYLDEQHGLKTRQQTAAEVLAGSAELPAEARAALRELLERGELVKFAGQAPSPPESDRAVELARQVILACAAAPAVGKGAGEGEQGKAVGVG